MPTAKKKKPAPKRRGPKRKSLEHHKAAGTYRKDRHGPPAEAPPARASAKWKPLTRAQLHRLIREVPGYDPFRDAAGYTFDCDRANRVLAFFPQELNHIEGALSGRPFVLERWQQAALANLYGWVRWSPKWRRWVRRYRETLWYLPRKQGKTPTIAGVALYELFEGEEAGQQNYLGASSRDQAGKLFRYAKAMLKANPALDGRCRVYGGTAQAGQSKSIVLMPEETSFLQVIAADGDAQHGGTSHLILIDELHALPDRELVQALTTSMASENRAEPLLVMLTTADFNRPSVCNAKHEYACKVRDGIIPDPAFLPVIYEALPEEDWTDEAVWHRVNPNLGVSVSLEYLRRECKIAQEDITEENKFKRLHLNMKTETAVRAIDMQKWDACGQPLDYRSLDGRECFGGLDLATTTDLAAFVLDFPEPDGSHTWLPYFWCPRETARVRGRRDRVPYEAWAQMGWLELTDGNVIDYDLIRKRVNELARRYFIRKVGRDRWNATQITTQLQGDGITLTDFGQGFASMTAPTKELLKLVAAGRLRHGGHPVLRWMASNAATRTDPAGNLKPDKERSTEKIDGIVAGIMALGEAMAWGGSVYDSQGMTVLGADGAEDAGPVQVVEADDDGDDW